MIRKKEDFKILLAEDEHTLQIVFRMQLKKLGYEVAAVVDSGLEAVDRASEQLFDLIFMDVRMPGLDGIAATKRIREREAGSPSRQIIVGLTAFAQSSICLEAGMDDFLQKPVLLEDLDAVLDKWLYNACAMPLKIVTNHFADEPLKTLSDSKIQLTAIAEKISKLRKSVGLE